MNFVDGRAYAETIFGSFLSLSILPKSPFAPYEYFENPLEMVHCFQYSILLIFSFIVQCLCLF